MKKYSNEVVKSLVIIIAVALCIPYCILRFSVSVVNYITKLIEKLIYGIDASVKVGK